MSTFTYTMQEGFEYDTHYISGFSLSIGNNYTDHHFIKFLAQQRPDIIEHLRSMPGDMGDDVIFEYKGTYHPEHRDVWAMSDLVDFLNALPDTEFDITGGDYED